MSADPLWDYDPLAGLIRDELANPSPGWSGNTYAVYGDIGMVNNPSVEEFVRETLPRASETISSLATLARVNPGLLEDTLRLAITIGIRSAVMTLEDERRREALIASLGGRMVRRPIVEDRHL